MARRCGSATLARCNVGLDWYTCQIPFWATAPADVSGQSVV